MSQVNYSNAIPNLSNGNEAARNLKIPPHSIEAEQSVIGAIMLDCNAFDRVSSLITPDDFYRLDHRLIWATAVELNASHTPFDLVTFSDFLDKQGNLKEAGGFAYLGTLAKDTPSAANVVAYAKIVKNDSTLRAIIATADKAKELAYSRQYDAKDVITELESASFKIADALISPAGEMVSLKVALKSTLQAMGERSKIDPATNPLLGVTTGSQALDKHTSGFVAGDLIIVAGRPSMGKTTFAMNAVHAASKDKAVAVFSMEMPTNQLVERLISSASTVNLTDIKNSWQLNQSNNWAKVSNGIENNLIDRNIYINASPSLNVHDIRASCRRLIRKIETKFKGLGLIVIDYLQLMEAARPGQNRNVELSDITRELKKTALEFNVPIILLSQLSRSVEQRPNKRPIMSDLRDSGAIEQDADMIMFLYRHEVYEPDDAASAGKAEVIIRKFRNGEIGTVHLKFEGQYSRFRDFDDSGRFGGDANYGSANNQNTRQRPPSATTRKQRGSF